MHIRVPFLAVLIISVFQIAAYGIQNNKHSQKDLEEILHVDMEEITEISITDLSGKEVHTTDAKQIKNFTDYLNQFQYKRLMNDQTGFMPDNTVSIYFYAGDNIDLIIPYGKEAFINHKVYRVKGGTINQDRLLEMVLTKSN